MNSAKVFKILLLVLSISSVVHAQERRRIQIDTAGFLDRDEVKFPGATILTRDDMNQVRISHEGATMWCDQAIHYSEEDFIEAYGNVKIVQGDTVNMTARYVEYSGKTKLAYARGEVILTEPSSVLTTDTLYFDRVKQQAYYTCTGQVVKDSSGTITSQVGRYYMDKSKYQFVKNVKLVNEEYTINSNQLDFYSDTGHSYLFGPTTIVGDSSKIYCEHGFYDTNNDIGYFMKDSRIDYDNRIIEGDSLYFDRNNSFASATNNIKITDTINNSIVKGHYAEVFKAKDSVFITKRALAITTQEQDSVYIHADTLMVTGKPEKRITRAFYNVKLFKSDLSGKADSIYLNHEEGLTKLINLKRYDTQDAFAGVRQPILWNIGNQMTGDTIHITSNTETNKLDSLKVFNNSFLISRDSVGDEFNQIFGQKLYGLFNKDNELYTVDVIKNAESIYYLRNDQQELVGIDKSKSGAIKIWLTDNNIDEVRKMKQVTGKVYPPEEFPKNADRLRGFVWRLNERPTSVDELFEDDPPLELPVIKGLDDYVPQEEFFDQPLMQRVDKAKPKKKDKSNKASRNIPEQFRKNYEESQKQKNTSGPSMKKGTLQTKKDN